MHSPFRVRANLSTPIILSPKAQLTLDSVLAFLMVSQEGMSFEQAVESMPLKRQGRVWCASAGFLNQEAAMLPTSFGFKRSVEPRQIAEEPFRVTGSGRNIDRESQSPKIDQVRGPYAALLDRYTAFEARYVEWYGCGDVQRVHELLRGLYAVGKKPRHGFGRVEELEEPEVLSVDISLVRRQGVHVRPMRPIPIEQWKADGLPTEGVHITHAAPDLPYMHCPEVLCVGPASKFKTWN